MAGKLDVKKFRKLLVNNKALQEKIVQTFERQFRRAKTEAEVNFALNPITKEIKAGPRSGNSSGILGGYGNLFSFLGFVEGSDPTDTISSILEKEIRYNAGKAKVTSKGIQIKFTVFIPTLTEIYEKTPMEWSARSWVEGIENGSVDGFQYFLSRINTPNSRSGGGYQLDTKIRNSKVRKSKYVSLILNKFRRRMDQIK